MYRRVVFLIIPVVLAITLISAIAGNDWLDDLLIRLENYRAEYPQEKVHLQLDKPYYSIGDDIWFKAYVVNTENNELSALSKVLYVELVDEQDSVKKTIALPIVNGLSNGDINLTDSLVNAGNYQVRAYTRWMQNFSSDYIFIKQITIGDARTPTSVVASAKFTFDEQFKLNAELTYLNLINNSPLAAKIVNYTVLYKGEEIASGKAVTDNAGKISFSKALKTAYKKDGVYLQTSINVSDNNPVKRNFSVFSQIAETDVQFFPEGGRLVNGLRSKVVFKATLPDGTGANIKGRIVDEANNVITDIASAHAGMGVFVLQPVAGKKYTAIINDGAGIEKHYDLPVADNEGYVLGVNNTDNDSITVKISASNSLVQAREVALVAMQNGVVRHTTKVKIDQPVISTRIAEKRFSTGIVQFTLLSADALPVAERLLFVNHHDQLKLNISTIKPVYHKRDKVDMQFMATDDEGQPVQANFSVSVTYENKVKVNEDAEVSIFSNLLLTSDLKGYIENPSYYFNGQSDAKVNHLDYLLLTHGWRRFNWKNLKENKLPFINYPAQKSLAVSGRIATLGGKPVPYGKVSLFATTPQGPVLVDTVANENGNFIINDLDLSGDVKVVVKAKNAKSKDNVNVFLNIPPRPAHNAFYIKQNESLSEAITNYLINTQKRFDALDNGMLNKTVMLKEVKVNDKRINKKYVVEGSKKLGLGIPEIVLHKEDLKRYSNLAQAFYGLPGIEVRGLIKQAVFMVGRGAGARPMLVLLNGSQIPADMLADIPPSDVEGIEILKAGYNLVVYGNEGSAGVIEITLKNGRTADPGLPANGIGHMVLHGYGAQREFYSPMYDKPDKRHAEADLRSTIYWNPNFVTDAEGKACLTYFNADQPGTYRVVAEGINIDGRLARQVFTYVVK